MNQTAANLPGPYLGLLKSPCDKSTEIFDFFSGSPSVSKYN